MVERCWFNTLLVSSSLNRNKEVIGTENNDVEPTVPNQPYCIPIQRLREHLIKQKMADLGRSDFLCHFYRDSLRISVVANINNFQANNLRTSEFTLNL